MTSKQPKKTIKKDAPKQLDGHRKPVPVSQKDVKRSEAAIMEYLESKSRKK